MPEGPDAERVIDQLAATGSNLIFTTSFGFMNPTIKVADRASQRQIRACHRLQAGATTCATYNARFYEGRHVIGLIAGKMTKTNTIGYIGSFPIPEVVMGINAAYLAAKSVNPNVKFKVVWVRPGSTQARKPPRPRRSSTREPTFSCSTPIHPRP